MENKTIQAILDSEKLADGFLTTAKEKASKILSEAEKDSQKIQKNAVEKSKENLATGKREQDELYYKKYLEDLADYEEKANEIKVSSRNNFDEVADFVMKKIIG